MCVRIFKDCLCDDIPATNVTKLHNIAHIMFVIFPSEHCTPRIYRPVDKGVMSLEVFGHVLTNAIVIPEFMPKSNRVYQVQDLTTCILLIVDLQTNVPRRIVGLGNLNREMLLEVQKYKNTN